MNKQITCPICGSQQIATKSFVENETMSLCEFSYNKVLHKCQNCGEEGDFTGETDEKFIQEYEKAKKASLELILEEFDEKKLSMAYIERALELSQRTLSRWKSQGISATGMTLMRMIYTFPWLLKIAGKKYDKDYADQELVTQAARVFREVMIKREMSPSEVHVHSMDDVFELKVKWTKGEFVRENLESKASSEPSPKIDNRKTKPLPVETATTS